MLDADEQQHVAQLLIYLLPACNSDTLHRLLEFLSTVTDHAHDKQDKDGQEVGLRFYLRDIKVIHQLQINVGCVIFSGFRIGMQFMYCCSWKALQLCINTHRLQLPWCLIDIAKVVIEITLCGWYVSAFLRACQPWVVRVAVGEYEQSGSRELYEIW